jgi:L-arabinonolactonase
MTTQLQAELLVDCGCTLGESIRWSAREQRVYWTDLEEGQLWSCDPLGGTVRRLQLPGRLCSFAFCGDGALLAAFADGLYLLTLNPVERQLLVAFEPDNPSTRLNDGRCDREGRFVVGGLDEAGLRPISTVIRYDGSSSQVLHSGIGCTNSIAFAPDGRKMYVADSPTGQIHVHDYPADSGVPLGPGKVFATLGERDGVPDGSCVDAEGGLWNASWGGGHVRRYSPQGALDVQVSVAASQVTCCCFGGPELDRLFITTARRDLSSRRLGQEPQAGAVFVARPGVEGLEEALFHAAR